MNSSLTRPNAQAVLDLYGYSDRLAIVSALNEDQRRHRVVEAVSALSGRLHRKRPERATSTTCATC